MPSSSDDQTAITWQQLRSSLHALEHVGHNQVLHSRYEPCLTAQEYASRLRTAGVFGLDALHQNAQRVGQISSEPIELALADPPRQAQSFTGAQNRIAVHLSERRRARQGDGQVLILAGGLSWAFASVARRSWWPDIEAAKDQSRLPLE